MPSLYRQIRLAVLAVLAFSTSVVDVALILGPTTPAPLAVRILDWQNDADLDLHFVAAAGAVLQVGVAALALVVWLAAERVRGDALPQARRVPAGARARDVWLRRVGGEPDGAVGRDRAAPAFALLALWSVAGPWRFPEVLPQSADACHLDAVGREPRDAASRYAGARRRLQPRRDRAGARLARMRRALTAARAGEGAASALRAADRAADRVPVRPANPLLLRRPRRDASSRSRSCISSSSFPTCSCRSPIRGAPGIRATATRSARSAAGPTRFSGACGCRCSSAPVLTATALGFAVSVALYLPTLLIGGGRWPTVTTEAVALASGGDPRLIGATALVQALLPFLGFAVAAIAVRRALPQPPAACGPRHERATPARRGLALEASRSGSTARAGQRSMRRVRPGEVLTLMGPSGVGKSTLLAFIGGFLGRDFRASGRIVAERPRRDGAAAASGAASACCSRTRCCCRISPSPAIS